MTDPYPKLIEDLGIKDFGTYRRRVGLYECPECEIHWEVQTSSIKSGRSTKCRTCANKKINISHGDVRTKLYTTWSNMKSRIKNKHKNYGGRGIEMCSEWQDYAVFKAWAILNGYNDNLTIERIDVNGNYEPSNCTWIPRGKQGWNQRKSILNRYSEELLSDAVEFYCSNETISMQFVSDLLECSVTSVKKLVIEAGASRGNRQRKIYVP